MSEELELTTLAEYEAIIERGLDTFFEVSMALLKIRELALYHPEYETFEEYCLKRWKWQRVQASRQLKAAEIVRSFTSLVPIGTLLPDNEVQIRALTRLDSPEDQRTAWTAAIEASKSGKPTYRDVEDAVRTQFEKRPTVAQEQADKRALEAEERAREIEERAEQLAREKREAEERAREAVRDRRDAEERAEQLLRERDEIQMNRYMRFRKLIDAVRNVAEFHFESAAEIWDGISNARGSDDFMEYLDNAQRCLTRLKLEHPNAVRKPGIVVQRPS